MDARLPFPQTINGESLKHKVVHNGFSALVQSEGLYFCTVQVLNGFKPRYGVYMRHGSPGGAFWRNSPPIQSFDDREKANEFIDTLAGLHNAHKAFEREFFTLDYR